MTIDYTIENVGPIRSAELRMEPGVNVLRGRNGVGKTTALRAVSRAAGGGADLEPRDGLERGYITGPGVRVVVGKVVHRRRGERVEGVVELSLADVAPFSQLIDPGLKDEEAAARAQVRALVQLVHVTLDEASLDTLAQGDATLRAWLEATVREEAIESVLLASERLRGHAHALAREQEAAAERAGGQALAAAERHDALQEALGDVGPTETTPQEAMDGLGAASEALAAARASHEARVDHVRRQESIRATLGERPDSAPAKESLEETIRRLNQVREEVRSVEARLLELRESQAALGVELERGSEQVRALEDAAEAWDRSKAVLDQPAKGATEEDCESKQRKLDEAKGMLALAQRSAEMREAGLEVQEASTRERAARAESARLRGFAHGLPQRLGELLAAAGAAGFTVVGGRVCYLRDGKPLDWQRRMSDGERVSAALELATQVYQADDVVPVEPRYWASLDPEARSHFGEQVRARGLHFLTEEPAEGELRLEKVS